MYFDMFGYCGDVPYLIESFVVTLLHSYCRQCQEAKCSISNSILDLCLRRIQNWFSAGEDIDFTYFSNTHTFNQCNSIGRN